MSMSISSLSSAYSQCSDAVAGGPPKKGRRSRASNSNVSTDSIPNQMPKNLVASFVDIDEDELRREILELGQSNQELLFQNRKLLSDVRNTTGQIQRITLENQDLKRRLRVAEAKLRNEESHGITGTTATQPVGISKNGYVIPPAPKSSTPPSRKAASRKRRRVIHQRQPRRLSLAAINILSTWLNRHGKEAGPTENDIHLLSKQTGLKSKRVSRCLQHIRASYPSPIEQFLLSSSSDEAPSEGVPESETNYSQSSLFHSPFEQIQFPNPNTNTLEFPPPPLNLDLNGIDCVFSERFVVPGLENLAEAERSFNFIPDLDITWPEPDTTGSPDSTSPIADFTPHCPLPKPDHLELLRAPESPLPGSMPLPTHDQRSGKSFHRQKKANGPGTFQCTFCHVRLTESAWKRHEESQHLPRRKWTCLLTGPTVNGRCAFCERDPGSDDHHDHGRVGECAARDSEERSFLRKDGLAQHLMSFHGAQLRPDVVTAWEVPSERGEQDWVCGFCGGTLNGWDARATHLAAHFRQGMTMDSWEL